MVSKKGYEREARQVPIRAVLFDCDNTMWWQADAWRRAVRLTLRKYGRKISRKTLARYNGGIIVAAIVRDYDIQADPNKVSAEINELHLQTTGHNVKPTPRVHEALERLSKRGLQLGAATSGYRDIVVPRLHRTGIVRYIPPERVVTRENVQRLKPHPDPLLLAAEIVGVEPQESVYVGDEPTDVQAARAAGMRSVIVANNRFRGKNDWGADMVVPYLYNLTPTALGRIGLIND